MGDADIEKIRKYMFSFKPDFLFSYPSSLVHLCDYMDRSRTPAYSPPKGIFTSGEQLYEWQRKRVEETFNTPVYNFYGCREVGNIAHECQRRNGLHVVMENVLVEVVNEKGLPVVEEEGDILVTDLNNYVMPFIRYKIGDRGKLLKRKCGCGRVGLPLMELAGRTFDIITSPSGSAVGGTFWTLLFKSKPGIQNFRVVQEKVDSILINYISEDGLPLSKEVIHSFRGEILARLPGLQIDFKQVKQFSALPSGKQQFVFSKIGAGRRSEGIIDDA
jgi:phenylacetate-CoA ligase